MKNLFQTNTKSSNSFSQQPASPPTGYNSLRLETSMTTSQPKPKPPPPQQQRQDPIIKKQSLFSRLIQPINSNHQIITSTTTTTTSTSFIDQLIIHWTSTNDHHLLQNWPQILELADRLSKSEPESRQAIKSIKKLISKSSDQQQQPIQIRAIRLLVILVLNSSDRFKLLVVKKLLDLLQDLYHKSLKSLRKQPIKDILLKAFAVLGHEFQHDQDLSAFTQFYNKIKPTDAPLNGTPLDVSDGLFAPISADLTPPSHQHQTASYPPPSSHDGLPQTIPVMRDVREEAEIARCNARLLIEALAFTHPSEMEDNEIIQEFHTKCLQSQNQLMDDIPWATEQAEQARIYYERQAGAVQASQPRETRVARTNPYGRERPIDGELASSREEQLLSLLLSANSELVDAFRQYDELERLARAERELHEVEERSKKETRLNPLLSSSLLTTDDRLIAGGSSSSSRPSIDLPSPRLAADLVQQQPIGYTLPDHDPHPSTDDEFYISSSSPRPPVSKSPTLPPPIKPHHPINNDPLDDVIITPIEPSAKALGKMRRFSGRSLAAPLGFDSNHIQLDHHDLNNHHPPSPSHH